MSNLPEGIDPVFLVVNKKNARNPLEHPYARQFKTLDAAKAQAEKDNSYATTYVIVEVHSKIVATVEHTMLTSSQLVDKTDQS